MTLYIISQVLMGIGLLIDLSGKIMKSKKFILIYITLANCFYVASYLCQLSPLPAVTNTCNFFRNISYLYLDKKKKPFKYYLIPMAIIFTSFGLALGFLWRNPMDLMMLASILICTICLAFKNLLIVRTGLIANSLMRLPYNIYIASYVGAATNIVNIACVLGAILYYHVISPKKKAKAAKQENEEIKLTETTDGTIVTATSNNIEAEEQKETENVEVEVKTE